MPKIQSLFWPSFYIKKIHSNRGADIQSLSWLSTTSMLTFFTPIVVKNYNFFCQSKYPPLLVYVVIEQSQAHFQYELNFLFNNTFLNLESLWYSIWKVNPHYILCTWVCKKNIIESLRWSSWNGGKLKFA